MNGALPLDYFVRKSLELHLFFGRIMKEHSIFLEAGFVSKDVAFAQQADAYKCQFTEILKEAVILSNGVISRETLDSGEYFTDKTARAEQVTQELSGICIDITVTTEAMRLNPSMGMNPIQLESRVRALNQKVINAVGDLASFKSNVLNGMLQCKLFTFNFPLLIIHIRREALFYIQELEKLQRNIVVDPLKEVIEEERFWNRQMAEHAEFISHLLDPTESVLIQTADDFADQFDYLEREALKVRPEKQAVNQLILESLSATRALRDFKATGTEGLLACKIKSIIIPLLADHVLREANHYLRVVKQSRQMLI